MYKNKWILSLITIIFYLAFASGCHQNTVSRAKHCGDLFVVSKYYGNVLTQGVVQIKQKLLIAACGTKVLYRKVSDMDPVGPHETKVLHNVMYFSTFKEAVQFAIEVLTNQKTLIERQNPKKMSSTEYKLILGTIEYYNGII